ncbi:MAG: DUF664 domain-containing protein [Frankiaceae bacterium]
MIRSQWRDARSLKHDPDPSVSMNEQSRSPLPKAMGTLREALVGMIEDYARHMDHVDLLRQRINGRIRARI